MLGWMMGQEFGGEVEDVEGLGDFGRFEPEVWNVGV
jgi:hypothetical protein